MITETTLTYNTSYNIKTNEMYSRLLIRPIPVLLLLLLETFLSLLSLSIIYSTLVCLFFMSSQYKIRGQVPCQPRGDSCPVANRSRAALLNLHRQECQPSKSKRIQVTDIEILDIRIVSIIRMADYITTKINANYIKKEIKISEVLII